MYCDGQVFFLSDVRYSYVFSICNWYDIVQRVWTCLPSSAPTVVTTNQILIGVSSNQLQSNLRRCALKKFLTIYVLGIWCIILTSSIGGESRGHCKKWHEINLLFQDIIYFPYRKRNGLKKTCYDFDEAARPSLG